MKKKQFLEVFCNIFFGQDESNPKVSVSIIPKYQKEFLSPSKSVSDETMDEDKDFDEKEDIELDESQLEQKTES